MTRSRESTIAVEGTEVCTGSARSSIARPDALTPALRVQLRSTTRQQVDSWLNQAEIISLKRFLGRVVAAGRGRSSTANVLTAIFIRLRHGEAVLDISEIALESGYSRPTVYRAIEYVAAPKVGDPKLRRVYPRKTGLRRPGWWAICPRIMVSQDEYCRIQKAQKQKLSSLSVNLSDNSPREAESSKPQAATAAQCPSNGISSQGAAPLHPAQITDPHDLLRWLDSPAADLDRPPTFGEKRKLAAALRLCRANYAISDAVLDALFWRTSLPLRVWRSAVCNLVDAGERLVRPKRSRQRHFGAGIVAIDISDPLPPEHWSRQPMGELQWRGRAAVKHLVAAPDGVNEFLRVLELGPPLTGRAVVRRAAILDGMIEETQAALAAIIRAAESARRKHRGAPCPECGKPIRAETRKPRRKAVPPTPYRIVNGRVMPIPLNVRMLAEYSEHGVYDLHRVISEYPDEPDGIWQTRRGAHRCTDRLAEKLRSLQSERNKLPVAPSAPPSPLNPSQRTRARISGIDASLARLHPGKDRERIAWLTAKRTSLTQRLKQERCREIASADLPLEQRIWLMLSQGRRTAAQLAVGLCVAEVDVAEALGQLAQKDWVRLFSERNGIWYGVAVDRPDERPPWEQTEGSDNDV